MQAPRQASTLDPEPFLRLARSRLPAATATAEPEDWLRGLSLCQAEQVLDQMESQGQPVLGITFEEATGFAIRWR